MMFELQSSIWITTLWIWLSGLVFAILHSGTASLAFKRWIYTFGMKAQQYRLFYSVVALLTTTAWLIFVHQLTDTALYQTEGLLWWLLIVLQVIGLLIVLAAFIPIDGLSFLGLRQAEDYVDSFIVEGVYRYIRHPMYTGFMLVLLAMPIQTYNGLQLSLIICVYFFLGSRLEEARMLMEHPEYSNYKKKVTAFVPHVLKIDKQGDFDCGSCAQYCGFSATLCRIPL